MSNFKKKILIIDDDETVLFVAKSILEQSNFEVVTYNQGFGATNKIVDEKPDLVLMDVSMPFLSGDKLTEILAEEEETRQVPIVFYSSQDRITLSELVKEHGVLGYISKGDPSELRRKVLHYLYDHE